MSATGDWSSADSTRVEAATAATSPFWWAPPAPPFLLCLDLASPSPIHPSAAGSLPDRMPPAIAASAPSTRIHFSGQPSHPSRSPVGETPLQGSCSAGQVTPEPPASGRGRTDHASARVTRAALVPRAIFVTGLKPWARIGLLLFSGLFDFSNPFSI
jgi:hypothetical protein